MQGRKTKAGAAFGSSFCTAIFSLWIFIAVTVKNYANDVIDANYANDVNDVIGGGMTGASQARFR